MNYVLDTLAEASVVLLVASGLVVVYAWGHLVNMAHGDLVMIGAYSFSITTSVGFSFPLAVLIAGAVAGVVLVMADLAFLRHLPPEDPIGLLATWGLGLILSEGVRISLGPGGRFVDPPVSGLVQFFGGSLPLYRGIITLLALFLCAFFLAITRWSRLGLRIRALVEAPDAALLLGINVRRGRTAIILAGGALAGLAGALIAPFAPVNPNLGPAYAATAFSVVLMSGTRVSALPIVAALFLGAIRIATQSLLQPATAALATMAISIAVILCFQSQVER